VRTLVEPPIFDPYFAAKEFRLTVLKLERIEVFADQK
jgi:hypothetical protein